MKFYFASSGNVKWNIRTRASRDFFYFHCGLIASGRESRWSSTRGNYYLSNGDFKHKGRGRHSTRRVDQNARLWVGSSLQTPSSILFSLSPFRWIPVTVTEDYSGINKEGNYFEEGSTVCRKSSGIVVSLHANVT